MTNKEIIIYLRDMTGMNGDSDPLWEVSDRLEEAQNLLSEAVKYHPVEQDQKLWSSRVREWLNK